MPPHKQFLLIPKAIKTTNITWKIIQSEICIKIFIKSTKTRREKKCSQVNLLSKFTCECKIIHGLSSSNIKLIQMFQ
jgi:hypothetical protein